MYELLKPLLFRSEPERIHNQVMQGLEFSSQHPGLLRLIKRLCQVTDQQLERSCFGLTFPNPIGLAAGFDKNARAIPACLALGFGFVEIGSVTALAQEGNPKPRLFRLPEDEAIINRMGFNNDGADAVARRLETLLKSSGKPAAPLGINLGKSKVTPLEDAPKDYLYSLSALWPYGDYFVINVSSPNTPGLRQLQDKDKLEHLLATVQAFVQRQSTSKPVLLKIAPDLDFGQIDEILMLINHYELKGVIATNTTVARVGLKNTLDEAGGLSGKPLRQRALEVLEHIQAQRPDLPIISVGGIATPADIRQRFAAGASLVQLYTSLIYQGPMLLRKLNKGLLALD
jgi:dihydroorotate dehydrogenase